MHSLTQARPAASLDCWGRFALQLRQRLNGWKDNLFSVFPFLQSAKMPHSENSICRLPQDKTNLRNINQA